MLNSAYLLQTVHEPSSKYEIKETVVHAVMYN